MRVSVALAALLFLSAGMMASELGVEEISRGADLPGETLEELEYRWELTGFLGRIAGLFLPSRGDGELATSHLSGDRLATRLRIESEESQKDEFWAYGARLEAVSGDTLAVWSAYRWRGEESAEREEIQESGVVGVVSGIYQLRQDPPSEARRMEIWSDGKLYPVIAVPGERRYFAVGGRTVKARLIRVRGLDLAGRRRWEGGLELWLTEDPAAIPVRIVVDRGWASVQLDLVEFPERETTTWAGGYDDEAAASPRESSQEVKDNQKELIRRTQ